MPLYEQTLNCKISVLGGDADSLFLAVENIDLYEKLIPQMIIDGILDTSNYAIDHVHYSRQHTAQLGCIKDEFKGKVCREIVMLAPKCYSMDIIGSSLKVASNGVGKDVASKLTHKIIKIVYYYRMSYRKLLRESRVSNINCITLSKIKLP